MELNGLLWLGVVLTSAGIVICLAVLMWIFNMHEYYWEHKAAKPLWCAVFVLLVLWSGFVYGWEITTPEKQIEAQAKEKTEIQNSCIIE